MIDWPRLIKHAAATYLDEEDEPVPPLTALQVMATNSGLSNAILLGIMNGTVKVTPKGVIERKLTLMACDYSTVEVCQSVGVTQEMLDKVMIIYPSEDAA